MVWDARCQPQMCQRTGMSFQGPVLIVPVSAPVTLSGFISHICCVSIWDRTPLQACSEGHHLKRVHQLNYRCSAGRMPMSLPQQGHQRVMTSDTLKDAGACYCYICLLLIFGHWRRMPTRLPQQSRQRAGRRDLAPWRPSTPSRLSCGCLTARSLPHQASTHASPGRCPRWAAFSLCRCPH